MAPPCLTLMTPMTVFPVASCAGSLPHSNMSSPKVLAPLPPCAPSLCSCLWVPLAPSHAQCSHLPACMTLQIKSPISHPESPLCVAHCHLFPVLFSALSVSTLSVSRDFPCGTSPGPAHLMTEAAPCLHQHPPSQRLSLLRNSYRLHFNFLTSLQCFR